MSDAGSQCRSSESRIVDPDENASASRTPCVTYGHAPRINIKKRKIPRFPA